MFSTWTLFGSQNPNLMMVSLNQGIDKIVEAVAVAIRFSLVGTPHQGYLERRYQDAVELIKRSVRPCSHYCQITSIYFAVMEVVEACCFAYSSRSYRNRSRKRRRRSVSLGVIPRRKWLGSGHVQRRASKPIPESNSKTGQSSVVSSFEQLF